MKKTKFNTVYAPNLNDTLHSDGSKTYETCNYGFITIKNPALVKLIEQQIRINGNGWFYMEALIKFKNSGLDIFNEIEDAMRILD